MTTKYKNTLTNNKLESDLETILSLKSCHLCTHQPVCIAFSLFKQSIEPNILDENTSLKAENLARICNIFTEKGLQ